MIRRLARDPFACSDDQKVDFAAVVNIQWETWRGDHARFARNFTKTAPFREKAAKTQVISDSFLA